MHQTDLNTVQLALLQSQVGKLGERVKDLERLNGDLPPWSDSSPSQKLRHLEIRTTRFFREHRALTKFNHEQQELKASPDFDKRPVFWSNPVTGQVYSIVDIDSFDFLANSPVAPMKLTEDYRKVYEVLVIDYKLVTLSRDFKGGLGYDFLWTPFADLDDPATHTKKHAPNDPRFGILDPETLECWRPDESVGLSSSSEDEDPCKKRSKKRSKKRCKKRCKKRSKKHSQSDSSSDSGEEGVEMRGKRKAMDVSEDEGSESAQGDASEEEELKEAILQHYHLLAPCKN